MTYWNANNESPAESNHRSAVRISSSRSQHHEQTAVAGRLTDTDGNGIPDHLDPDDDEDGIPDYLDADDDGDGTPDVDDSDDDNDGTPDAQDLDDDVDGTRDTVEKTTKGVDRTADTKRDGSPDHPDSDDDSDKTPGRQRQRNCRLPGAARFERRRNTGQRGRRRRRGRNRRRRRSRPLHLLLFTVVMYGGVFWVGTQNVNV